jgi:2-iminobutanoate/2-iminopropanoate deaminase
MLRHVTTPNAPAPIGPYSQAVWAGPSLFISGMIALTPEGELRNESLDSEVRTALTNLVAVLESQGMGTQHLAKCSLFLRDMADFAAVNAIYTEFMGDAKPARETVAVLGLPKDARFEISAVAYLPL